MAVGLTRPILRLLFIILAFFPAVWITLGLIYLGLPSPAAISRFELEQQALRTLNAFVQSYSRPEGLVRVYDRQHFFPASSNSADNVWEIASGNKVHTVDLQHLYNRDYFALEYAWDHRGGGSSSFPSSSLEIRSLSSTERIDCSEILFSGNKTSKIIVPFAKIGDSDGVSLPWFHLGDAALLYADSRIMVGEVGMAPLVLEAVCSLEVLDNSPERTRLEIFALNRQSQRFREPLIDLLISDDNEVETAVFPVVDEEETKIEDRRCWSLSRTYLARQILLQFLGPTALIVNAVLDGPFIAAFGPIIFFCLRTVFWMSSLGLVIYMIIVKKRKEQRRLLPTTETIDPPSDRKQPYTFFGSPQLPRPKQAVFSLESMRTDQRLFGMRTSV